MTDDAKALVEELRECERDIFGTIYGRSANMIEAQAAKIERLRRDHAAMVKEANIAKARLKGVQKQWHADRAALKETK